MRLTQKDILFGTNKDVCSTKSLNYMVCQASSPERLCLKLVF